jgi:hypothetical protein
MDLLAIVWTKFRVQPESGGNIILPFNVISVTNRYFCDLTHQLAPCLPPSAFKFRLKVDGWYKKKNARKPIQIYVYRITQITSAGSNSGDTICK